jgi:hypothetical protein
VGPGTQFDGFVIETVAGRGGMGVVYRARQTRPDRVVALKVIAADLADSPEFRARFQRESAIAAQIEHPNVIPVHAVGEVDGVLYIAMRFVDGVDLRTLLAQEGRLEPRRAATIVDQVAQALDAAHAHGLVHRDVKPANVLISRAGGRDHVYLSDFGLSRHVEGSQGLTGTGAFLGTIDYVAPEQARGEPVDARTDVYALGCLLFHTLTGTVPFPLDNELAKLYAHGTQAPPSPLERVPDLPATFEPVLARAMAKAPDDRYLSAGDLGRAAVAAAEGSSLSRAERSVAAAGATPQGVSTVPARSGSDPTMRGGENAGAAAEPTVRRPRRASPSLRVLLPAGVLVMVAVAGILALANGGDDKRAPAIPAANVTSNPSFERDLSGWDRFQSRVERERVPDAPDGEHVARVALAGSPDEYSIDDEPETVSSSVKGRTYVAAAWVKAAQGTADQRVCISLRESRPEGSDDYVGFASASIKASAGEYRKVRVTYVAKATDDRIGVHVFRYPPGVHEGEAFLVDAITITRGAGGPGSSPPNHAEGC